MKDEIKEILDKAKEISDYGEDGKQHTRMFNQFEAKALLDYITKLQEDLDYQRQAEIEYNEKHTKLMNKYKNLQEENERLKENAIHNDKVVDKAKWNEMLYKSRNEKAIEFVKKESKKCYTNQTNENPLKVIGNFMWHTDKLLNILEGDDKNESR